MQHVEPSSGIGLGRPVKRVITSVDVSNFLCCSRRIGDGCGRGARSPYPVLWGGTGSIPTSSAASARSRVRVYWSGAPNWAGERLSRSNRPSRVQRRGGPRQTQRSAEAGRGRLRQQTAGLGTTSLGYDVAEALIRRSAGADRIRGLRGVQAGQL
jgi:hypothetical protein